MSLIEWNPGKFIFAFSGVPAIAPAEQRTMLVPINNARVVTVGVDYERFIGAAATSVSLTIQSLLEPQIPAYDFKNGVLSGNTLTLDAGPMTAVMPVTQTERFILRMDELAIPYLKILFELNAGNANDFITAWYILST